VRTTLATLATAVLFAAALAGCASDPPGPTDGFTDPGPADAIPTGADHDHRDPAAHRHARAAHLLDTLSLQEFGAGADLIVGAHALDIHGDLLAVAVFGNHDDSGGQQGVHLVDVSHPADLRVVGTYDAGTPVRGDRTIAFSADGTTVFLGFESGPRPGVAAVDVSDPTAPVEVAFWSDPAGFGPHTVAAGVVGGEQYVFLLSLGVTTLAYDGAAGAFTFVGKYLTADQLAFLDVIGHAQVDPTNPGGGIGYGQTYLLRTLYGHDMTFYADPMGLPLLLVAYAYDGLKILDISEPALPVPLARFLPPTDTSHRHYTHTVAAERLADGRLIVVVGSETFEPENQGIASPIWILDSTEAVANADALDAPELLSTWRNPSAAPAEELTQSVHFFRLRDGFLHLSHYHGGVWAFDLRDDASRRAAEAFAFILPVPVEPVAPPEDCCIGFPLAGVPMVFDVAVGDDGTVYAADIIQGVSSIRLDYPVD
jgi:hypothetical protein